jgi:hypothetical protein
MTLAVDVETSRCACGWCQKYHGEPVRSSQEVARAHVYTLATVATDCLGAGTTVLY